jgi:hypothetical protein
MMIAKNNLLAGGYLALVYLLRLAQFIYLNELNVLK